MKKFSMALALVVSFLPFAACDSTGDSSTETTEVAQVPEGMKVFNLSGHPVAGLPMEMNVPDENTGIPEIKEGPMGGTQVTVGKDFNLEIFPGGGDVAAKKQEIEGNSIFKTTYLVDEPDALLYTWEIEGTDTKQYHFYYVKEIEGNKYEVFDVQDGEYTEAGVKQMLEAAKSLRPVSGTQPA